MGKDCSLLHKRRTFSTEGPELSSAVSVLGRIKGSDAERGENISLIRCIDDMKMAEKKKYRRSRDPEKKKQDNVPILWGKQSQASGGRNGVRADEDRSVPVLSECVRDGVVWSCTGMKSS